MTNKEAIEKLKEISFMTGYNEAIDLAIKSLKREVQWEEDNAFREKRWGKQNDQ